MSFWGLYWPLDQREDTTEQVLRIFVLYNCKLMSQSKTELSKMAKNSDALKKGKH